MKKETLKFKFKKIKNFLNKEEINICREYFLIQHKNNIKDFDTGQNANLDTKKYADPLVESLLLNKKNVVEKEINLNLLPSYSFYRVYTMFSELVKHSDRPSCEVSVTVMVGSSGEKWPIFMDGVPVELSPGDAVIYAGCDVEHWREEFLGDWHAQFFLHYVNENGPYTEYKLDKRPYLGALEWMRGVITKEDKK
tara:strand:- start:441 stop:1025 length:585 start_codon:yes stop_codon:yes gene_type:complete